MVKSETIFPQIGEELRDQGGIAILVAMLVILVYIIFRFQIKFGYGAIAALFHDVLIILGIFSIFNLTFDLSADRSKVKLNIEKIPRMIKTS